MIIPVKDIKKDTVFAECDTLGWTGTYISLEDAKHYNDDNKQGWEAKCKCLDSLYDVDIGTIIPFFENDDYSGALGLIIAQNVPKKA